MPKFNSHKKKQRSAKTTLLIYCEGLHEVVFVKHLKQMYAFNSNVNVRIWKGKGGDAVSIVLDAAKIPGSFNRKFVLIDKDKSDVEMSSAQKQATKRGIKLIQNLPCLEAMLLSILNEGESYAGKTSDWCKKEFESKYLDAKKRTDQSKIEKLFPKTLLDQRKLKIQNLAVLIGLIEGK